MSVPVPDILKPYLKRLEELAEERDKLQEQVDNLADEREETNIQIHELETVLRIEQTVRKDREHERDMFEQQVKEWKQKFQDLSVAAVTKASEDTETINGLWSFIQQERLHRDELIEMLDHERDELRRVKVELDGLVYAARNLRQSILPEK